MFQNYKLGLVPHVPQQLAMAPQLGGHPLASMTAPPKMLRPFASYVPTLGDNDKVGDCTCVGIANYALGVSALNNFSLDIPTTNILDLYTNSCGYNPNVPPMSNGENPTDKGGNEANVLKYQVQNGFKIVNDSLVADWATYNPLDLNLMRNVISYYGLSYLGVALALSDQKPGVWDTNTPAASGDSTPGSWGYHCLDIWEYDGTDDDSLVTLVTWGTFQQATWRWVKSRLTEAHLLMFRSLASPAPSSYFGIDYDKLKSDMQTFMDY